MARSKDQDQVDKVAKLKKQGLSYRTIAQRLGVSLRTVQRLAASE